MKKTLLLKQLQQRDLDALLDSGFKLKSKQGRHCVVADLSEDLSPLKPWLECSEWERFNQERVDKLGLFPEAVLDTHPTSTLELLVINHCERLKKDTAVRHSYCSKSELGVNFASNLVSLHNIINDINGVLESQDSGLVVRGAGFSLKTEKLSSNLQGVLLINKRFNETQASFSDDDMELAKEISMGFAHSESKSYKVIELLAQSNFFSRYFNPMYEQGEMLFFYTPRRHEDEHNAMIQVQSVPSNKAAIH